MKGIYLTKEGKQEIENRLIELDKLMKLVQKTANDDKDFGIMQNITYTSYTREKKFLKEILFSATILPVEESWGDVPIGTNECELVLSDGVIIKPKQ